MGKEAAQNLGTRLLLLLCPKKVPKSETVGRPFQLISPVEGENTVNK
jgi:hypothetical protein